jgi:hypothetical protein
VIGVVGLSNIGRATGAGGGAIAGRAQRLHDDLERLRVSLVTALRNIITRVGAKLGTSDHETLAAFALIREIRLWDPSTADTANFNCNDIIQHISQIGLTPGEIDGTKGSMNESIRRLHAGRRIPGYFVPLNGNPGVVGDYILP